jgi:hypothetical protein
VTWDLVKPWFAPDGALRDIYVHDTSRSDWQALIAGLATWGYPTHWAIDGRDASPRASADAAFAASEHAAVLLRIDVASVKLHCHFFTADEIELDLDPKQVHDQSAFDAVLTFLRRLGDSLKKPVKLTMENCPEALIVVYSPTHRSFDYHPPVKTSGVGLSMQKGACAFQLLIGSFWVGKGFLNLARGKDSGYWADDFLFGGILLTLGVFMLIGAIRSRSQSERNA